MFCLYQYVFLINIVYQVADEKKIPKKVPHFYI